MNKEQISQLHNIPEELKANGQFCLWKYEQDKNGRPTKVPYNPNNTNYHASVSDPGTFSTYEEAMAALGTNNTFSGIGIRVNGDLVGVDIDHCVNEAGELDERAKAIMDTLSSYTEISPSGHGVRIFLKAEYIAYDKDTYYIKHGDLEVYIPGYTNRFLTVTGNVLREAGIEERTAELQAVLDEYMKRRPKTSETRQNTPKTPLNVSDAELLEKAMKNDTTGNTFVSLWNGDISGYNSQSEADMALCRLLSFWTARDYNRIDTMFRQSELYREKWDEMRGPATYGEATITKAIETTAKVYDPDYYKEEAGGIELPENWDNWDNSGPSDPGTGTPENEAPKEEPEDAFAEFWEEIQTTKFKPISTGIKSLDEALSGGLERKTLVTLASAPGMGKTAFCQFLFENMAKAGHPVIYVNLEMDRSQLLSRSIARIAHEQNNGVHKIASKTWEETAQEAIEGNITGLTVKRGYEWTPKQRARIERAASYYRNEIMPRFHYVTTNPENSGHIKPTLTAIMAKLEQMAEGMKAAGLEAPLVCIDYLQFVKDDLYTLDPKGKTKKPDTAEAIAEILATFKNFAMKHSTVVLLIMANNRTANKEGRASMDSGRDTSNIEYSGDVMLSLTYTAIEDHWKLENADTYKDGTPKDPIEFDMETLNSRIDFCKTNGYGETFLSRKVCVKVVKGRSIESRKAARFIFEAAYSSYVEDPEPPEFGKLIELSSYTKQKKAEGVLDKAKQLTPI